MSQISKKSADTNFCVSEQTAGSNLAGGLEEGSGFGLIQRGRTATKPWRGQAGPATKPGHGSVGGITHRPARAQRTAHASHARCGVGGDGASTSNRTTLELSRTRQTRTRPRMEPFGEEVAAVKTKSAGLSELIKMKMKGGGEEKMGVT